jgi:hypothetical protein
MAMTMQEFITLADHDLAEIRFEVERELPEQYSKFCNVVTQADLYRREAKMAGFGDFAEIPEGGNVTYQTAIPPVTRRYDLVKRGSGYKITEKLWKFDRYREVQQFERALMRADRYDTEKFFAAIFNNATNTTISAGFDGLPLASTAHTRLDGGAVISNRFTVNQALSLTSLIDAVIAFRKFVDDRGRRYLSEPRILMIPTDLIVTAYEILQSALRPDTANNTTNAVRMFNLVAEEYPFLTSPTYWALLGPNHDINAIWNERPNTKNETDFDSQTIKRFVQKWMGRGHGEWRDFFLGST